MHPVRTEHPAYPFPAAATIRAGRTGRHRVALSTRRRTRVQPSLRGPCTVFRAQGISPVYQPTQRREEGSRRRAGRRKTSLLTNALACRIDKRMHVMRNLQAAVRITTGTSAHLRVDGSFASAEGVAPAPETFRLPLRARATWPDCPARNHSAYPKVGPPCRHMLRSNAASPCSN